MLRKQTALHIAGAILVCAMGTLAHFVYEWSGNNPVVGLFCAVNESTWEHIKLLFFPMLLYTGWRAVRTHGREPAATAAFLAGNLAGCVYSGCVLYLYGDTRVPFAGAGHRNVCSQCGRRVHCGAPCDAMGRPGPLAGSVDWGNGVVGGGIFRIHVHATEHRVVRFPIKALKVWRFGRGHGIIAAAKGRK